jgi:hypothetical protein
LILSWNKWATTHKVICFPRVWGVSGGGGTEQNGGWRCLTESGKRW